MDWAAEICDDGVAFVALVSPLASIRGVASPHLLLLFFFCKIALERRGKPNERTRNSEVVQCQQGIRVHSTPIRRRCFCSLFGHTRRRVQVIERWPGS